MRAGLIPENTPGYSIAEFRNALEERAMETLDVEALNKERQDRIHHYYEHHGGHPPAQEEHHH